MLLEAVRKRIFSFSYKNAHQNGIIRENISYCVVRRSYNNRRRLLKLLPTMQQQVHCQLLFNWMIFYQTNINYSKFSRQFFGLAQIQIYSETIFKMRISTFSIKLSHFYLIPNQQTSGLIENNFSNSLRYWIYPQFQLLYFYNSTRGLSLYPSDKKGLWMSCEIIILFSRGNCHYLTPET